jgi:hypothetical protein
MPLDLLLLPVLALATAAVWWRVWVTRPVRRPRRPEGGPRLEERQSLCKLCGRGGHTAREHVRVPQAELESWGQGHSGASSWTCGSNWPKMSGQTWQRLWRLGKP